MTKKAKLKKMPVLLTDEDAGHFVDEADLSEYDLSEFKPVHFEFENKSARVNMRLPQSQLAALRAEAKKRGIPYQRFMREMLSRGMESLRKV